MARSVTRSRNLDEGQTLLVEPCVAEFLAHDFGSYLELVRLAELHPGNRSCADKTWVELAMSGYQKHYRSAKPSD